MVTIRRNHQEFAPIDSGGPPMMLTVEAWVVAFGLGPIGLGWTYRRPSRVVIGEGTGVSSPIRDHVMLVRLAAITVVLAAHMVRLAGFGRWIRER